MKNSRKVFIFSTVLLFFVRDCFCLFGMTPAGVEAIKEMGASGVKIVKEVTGGAGTLLTEHGETIGNITANIGVEASKNLGVETAKVAVGFGEKFVPMAWTLTGAIVAYEAYSIGCDVKKSLSDKSAGDVLEDRERYKLLKARKELRESLEKNANGPRGSLGIPIACEEKVRQLALAGGGDDAKKIIETFKEWFVECSN